MPQPRLSRLLPLLLAASALSACEVGPNYHQPSAPTTPAYKEIAGWTAAQPSDAADRADWWTVFNDPVLKRPGAEGGGLQPEPGRGRGRLSAGPGDRLRTARCALAQRHRQRLGYGVQDWPRRQRGGRNGDHQAVAASCRTTTCNWAAPGSRISGARWRRTIENAKATAEASDADLANVRLSAQMELAADYVTLRQFDEEKRLDDDTGESLRRIPRHHPQQVQCRQRRAQRRRCRPRPSCTTPRRPPSR